MTTLTLKPLALAIALVGIALSTRASALDSLLAVAADQAVFERSATLLAIGRHYSRIDGKSDSARHYLSLSRELAQTNEQLALAARAALALVKVYHDDLEYDSVYSANRSAVELALGSKDSNLIFISYEGLGRFWIGRQDAKESIIYFQKALNYLNHSENPDRYARTLAAIAHSYSFMGMYDRAREEYEVLFANTDILSNVQPKTACSIHLGMGTLYSLLGMTKEAKLSAAAARESANRANHSTYKVRSLALTASIHSRANELDYAEKYGLIAYQLADSLGADRALGVIANNLGNLYIKLRRFGAAENYLARAIEIAVVNDYTLSLAVRYCTLTELYIESGQVSKAAAAAADASVHAVDVSDPQVLVELYSNLARIDSMRGDFRSAFANLGLHHRHRDSLFALEKLETIAELETEYEVAAKENEIALLTTDQELQAAANAQMRQRLLLLAGGAAALLLLAGVLVNRNRIKQRALETSRAQNAVIAAKSRENELLVREIHHRVKNNMAIMQGLLRAQRAHFRDNGELVGALKVCEGQLASMALIHQDLYEADNVTAVGAREYFAKVLRHIRGAYPERCGRVAFAVDLADVDLAIATAVPLGLILNELVTNAVKYAFPAGATDEPKITVTLTSTTESLTLSVRDNGRGLPAGVARGGRPGFGLRMVEGLAQQLGGALEYRTARGTSAALKVSRTSSGTFTQATSASPEESYAAV